MTLWGSRFRAEPDPLLARFADSYADDRRLLPYEIQASEAWAEALHAAGVLSEAERAAIDSGLRWIRERASSDPGFLEGPFEDVHTFVEERLTEKIGEAARKLHTGRSRNDQVATDLRLFTRDAVARTRESVWKLRRDLVSLARRDGGNAIPGYTHLQRAQPILFGHLLLAHFERFGRDDGRLADAARRADACPLGSGALAGSAFPIDRDRLAARLGFSRPTSNSLDAVADRDFVVEVLAALALCGAHLSQLGEDVVIFSTEEFGFLAIDDEAATGSSLMPQKKNADHAELLRAKGGALAGPLVSMLAVLKSLPSGYDRDLQEDKPIFFRAVDAARGCLEAAAALVSHLSIRADRAAGAAASPALFATEIADHLARAGLPFRDAHAAVGRAVRLAEDRGVPLDRLGADDWDSVHPGLAREIDGLFDVIATLERRDVAGGTAPRRFHEAILRAEEDLSR